MDTNETIEYRKTMRENYLREKRIELEMEWNRRDKEIYWDGPEGKKAKDNR